VLVAEEAAGQPAVQHGICCLDNISSNLHPGLPLMKNAIADCSHCSILTISRAVAS
jgi:hypothetical protein